MKKKILFIMPNIEMGGIEKNLILLTSSLIKEFEVCVVCGEISDEIKKNLDQNIELIISKKFFKNKIFSRRVNNTINSFLEIIRNKKKIITNETIIFSLQNHPFPIILSKILNKKIIIRIANHPQASLKYFNNNINYLFKLFIKIFFYKFSDGIICNSNSSRHYLEKFLKRSSIITIFNPINFEKNVVRSENCENLLTIGRLENQKNISGIILALKEVKIKFPKIKLLIIGGGSERQLLEQLVEKNNLKENVEFKGFINPKKYLLSSKILILNSFFEGLPNVLIEGMASKIPIISTDCESGPREILENGRFGALIKVNETEELYKKIIYTLENYDEAKKKSEEGFKSLVRFDKTTQLKKINDYISRI